MSNNRTTDARCPMPDDVCADCGYRCADDALALEAFRQAAASYVRQATASPQAANATLVRIGTHDVDGNLTEHYR